MKTLYETLKETNQQSNQTFNSYIQTLYDYVAGINTDITYRLRTYTASTSDKNIADKISSLMKFIKLPVLYRGMLWEDVENWFGFSKDTLDDWKGSIFVDNGFVSTSTDKNVPWNNFLKNSDTVLFIIKSKKPYKAIDINAILQDASPSPSDKEILLDRNTKFKIVKYDVKSGIYFVELEIVS